MLLLPFDAIATDTARVFGVTFLVFASKILRPGHIYQLSVTNYSPSTINTYASILKDGVDIANAEQACSVGVPETIMMSVPAQALEGSYKLKVIGTNELGATIFSNETSLEFSQRSMTIFVQTDKPIYKQGQTVKFRVVPITTDLKPFSDALDVYMLDPNGLVVRRWLSKQTNLGSVSIEYPLSDQPTIGNWTIRVSAQGQIQDGHFLVEFYYPQQFEVNVSMPSSFLETDKYIAGSITANFTNGAPVVGNLTITVTVEHPNSKPDSQLQFDPDFHGYDQFRFETNSLKNLVAGSKVIVTAHLRERYIDSNQNGHAIAHILSSRIKLKFVGPSVHLYKPQMPFQLYLAVSYQDGSHVPASLLRDRMNIIDIKLLGISKTGSGIPELLPNRTHDINSQIPGIWSVSIDLRSNVGRRQNFEYDYLILSAEFNDRTSLRASTKIRLYSIYASNPRSLQISTSTFNAKVGEYVVFHAKANYPLATLSYIIISKGIILTTGREQVSSSLHTFAVPVSAEMAPSSTILIYDIANGNEVITDALKFHVDGTSLHNFTVSVNDRKDKHGESLEFTVHGQPGTFVGIYGVNKDLASLSSSGQITHINFNQQMQNFDRVSDTLTHQWLNHEGSIKDIVNFPSPSQGIDTSTVFMNSGLIVFTDAFIAKRPWSNCPNGMTACLSTSICYNATTQTCNGKDDCGDNSDESGCDVLLSNWIDTRTSDRLHRFNRLQGLYEDNWLWRDVNIGPNGYYIFTVPLPTVVSTWSIGAFSMSGQHGIGIMREPMEVSSLRPFIVKIEMPTTCNLGEQIGVRALVTSFVSEEIEVMITLADSIDYKFVHVGENGEVASYNPETSFGEHQHLIAVNSGETSFVYIPIVAQRLGQINVTITATTQVAKKSVTRILKVEADGLPQRTYTSFNCDLSQGSYCHKYLDTNITETPVVKYDNVRRYIYGSNTGRLSFAGDYPGPLDILFNSESILKLPSDGADQNIFNFAHKLESISYLRKTNQDTPDRRKEAFKLLTLLYQRQLTFRNKDGSFRLFKSSQEPSVWLTAFVIRELHEATKQEWENHIYIDPEVIDRGMSWLVSKQTKDGFFIEQHPYAYDRKMEGGIRWQDDRYENSRIKNVSLTAHVLITLHLVGERGLGQSGRVTIAKINAQKYLEQMLQKTMIKTARDPFDLALLSYALTVVDSIASDEAYDYLIKQMRQQDGMKYWAPENVPHDTAVIINNRQLIYPKKKGRYDARSVQTTAYALMTFLEKQIQIPYQADIVEWLNRQRLSVGGWASTQDTLAALRALMVYSIKNDQRSVTNIKVTVDDPSSRKAYTLYINEGNVSTLQTIDFAEAHGILEVTVEGPGIILMGLDLKYNVDWPQLQIPPPVKAFDLNVKSTYSGRNSSNLMMEVCVRWALTSESPRSGMAVLEVPLPTGYQITQSKLDLYVNTSNQRNLREARVAERKIYYYFDYVSIVLG